MIHGMRVSCTVLLVAAGCSTSGTGESGWQLGTTAAENYQRILGPNLFAPWAKDLVKRAGVVFTEADLNAHCRERLAGYKCPKSIKFVRELPKSAAGKILKPDLRAAFTAAS